MVLFSMGLQRPMQIFYSDTSKIDLNIVLSIIKAATSSFKLQQKEYRETRVVGLTSLAICRQLRVTAG